jgi:hypothetical protein
MVMHVSLHSHTRHTWLSSEVLRLPTLLTGPAAPMTVAVGTGPCDVVCAELALGGSRG